MSATLSLTNCVARSSMNAFYPGFGKRALDVVVASVLLFVLSPVLAVVSVLVRVKLGSPVLFRQQRPGRDAVPFELLKFRTMSDERDSSGDLLPDAARLGSFGRFLRASSLDELPELWNVMTGDMSLVGPRPLLMEYLSRYSLEQARRHELRPGLTGWAQVNGRNAVSWTDRFAMDIWYVDHASFALDLRILGKTIAAVFRREGIAAEGEATMPPFLGNDPVN